MKAVTIKQPYATLIAKGYKKFEFRSWKTKYRGPLLIHAGKGVDKKQMKKYKDLNLDFPSGVIVAEVYLSDCILVDKEFNLELNKISAIYSHSYEGYYAWKLDNVKEIKSNKTINGKLSLWDIDKNDF